MVRNKDGKPKRTNHDIPQTPFKKQGSPFARTLQLGIQDHLQQENQ